jgi:hypothetical protein
MAIERRSDRYLHAWKLALHRGDHRRQIALEVDSEGKKIGQYVDLAHATCGEKADRTGEIGLAAFEKSGFDSGEPALARKIPGNAADGLVGRFHAGSVRKNYDARLIVCPQQVL